MIQHATITPYTDSLDYACTVRMTCDVGYRFQDGTEEKDFICDPITEWEALMDTVCYSKCITLIRSNSAYWGKSSQGPTLLDAHIG